MARPTILLTRPDIAGHIAIGEAIPIIERAMAEFEKGQDYLPPKAIFELPVGAGCLAACITGYTKGAGLLSMKVGQERTANPSRGLPTTNSWVLVFEPQTGELLMICDGTLPTMCRTAAAAAVATRRLAREDARTLAVIGAGQLGRQCLRAVSGVRRFERIYLHDFMPDAAQDVGRQLQKELSIPIEVADGQTACSKADVIVTATNSRKPIVMSAWVRPGTHLSCMGADLHEKIECEPALLTRCRLFADQIEHCVKRGEVSQAIEQGVLRPTCFAGSLGQVINGAVPGRKNDDDITLYDAVGIGIQDTAIARVIYDQAAARGLGTQIAFS